MKNANPFMLFIGVFWMLVAVPYLVSLFPIGQRLVQRMELKLKPRAKTITRISRVRRLIFVLLCGLLAAVEFASAFHHSLDSPAIMFFMVSLPVLYLFLGIWDKPSRSRNGPAA
jgi:hypothetical protein